MHKGKDENAMSVADVDRLKKQGMKVSVKEKVDNHAVGMDRWKKEWYTLWKNLLLQSTRYCKSIKKWRFWISDAQRKAAFGSGKEKGKDKKEDTEWKTFAQLRTEVDEACWDSHKQVGFKMKGGKEY